MNNPPAFPRPFGRQSSAWNQAQEGMTLLEYFAGHALQGLLAHHELGLNSLNWIVEESYKHAIGMVQQRDYWIKQL